MKKHPLVQFSQTGRFGGGVYETPTGEPVAATTGSALIVLGARSVDDMAKIVAASQPKPAKTAPAPLPSVATVLSVIEPCRTATRTEPVAVSLATPPDPILLQHATDHAAQLAADAAQELPAIEQQQRQAEAALAADRAAKRIGRIGRLRDEAAKWRQKADDTRRQARGIPQGLEMHALVVENVAYDLDLIVSALKVLRAQSGQLVGTGCCAPGLLTCDRGMALVMPFRTAALAKEQT